MGYIASGGTLLRRQDRPRGARLPQSQRHEPQPAGRRRAWSRASSAARAATTSATRTPANTSRRRSPSRSWSSPRATSRSRSTRSPPASPRPRRSPATTSSIRHGTGLQLARACTTRSTATTATRSTATHRVPNYPASHGCLRTFIADQPRDLRTAPLRRETSSSGRAAMKVFVAGASGAIGRPLVRQLVAAGHEVTGMTRRQERAEEIRAAGAEAVVCDVFDAEALKEAVAAAAPEAVVHALTALPPKFNPKSDYLAATNRVRTEGTRNLVAAARAAGARRLVAESVAFFYRARGRLGQGRGGAAVRRCAGPLRRRLRRRSPTLERQVLGAEGMEGAGPALRLALRPRHLLRPRRLAGRGNAEAALPDRRRRAPAPSPSSTSRTPPRATVAALERGAPGVYNVVDDEPAPLREWLPVYAEALGAKPPRRVPVWLARLVAGKDVGRVGDRAARRRQRQGQARARLAAGATRAGARASRDALADARLAGSRRRDLGCAP